MWLEKLKTAPGVTPEVIARVKSESVAEAIVKLLEGGYRVMPHPDKDDELLADCPCCVEKRLEKKKPN